jgi:phosphate transport system substrate-binding protein
MMSKWVGEYEKSHRVELRYISAGSGMGIDDMISRKLDFGCTDTPMNDEELTRAREAGGEVLHVPLMMGAVVPVYNLPGMAEPLRFTGPVLAEIFLGKIDKWNDPALQLLNPGIPLPDEKIWVVHRLDSSGTTFVWSDYLAKVSPEWKIKMGVGKLLKWRVGEAGNGNQGVASYLRQDVGSIGYVELTYAVQENLQFGSVQNREGQFIKAEPAAVTAAAESLLPSAPDHLRFSLVNAPGPKSYPITGTSWAVLYKDQPAEKGGLVLDFLRWATHEGQQYAEEMNYAPLPSSLVRLLEGKLEEVRIAP